MDWPQDHYRRGYEAKMRDSVRWCVLVQCTGTTNLGPRLTETGPARHGRIGSNDGVFLNCRECVLATLGAWVLGMTTHDHGKIMAPTFVALPLFRELRRL